MLEPQTDPSAPTNVDSPSAGIVLGTPAYMSPEQARGKPIDKRTDIWAFGCVLFELLTGRPAFQGETVTDILAAVVERDPDWAALPSTVPLKIYELLRRCLQKDARHRLRDIGDARILVEEAIREPVGAGSGSVIQRRWQWLALALIVVLAIGAAIGFLITRGPAPERSDQVRLLITPLPMPNPYAISVSPNGRKIAFVSRAGGVNRLYVRPIDSVDAQPLSGTEGADHPFWSPDSRYIGFVSGRTLKKVEATGGTPQKLCDLLGFFGASWNSEDVILFSQLKAGRPHLFRVPASGGAPVEAAIPNQTAHEALRLWPSFLPDGRHYLYMSGGTRLETRAVHVGSLDSNDTAPITVVVNWTTRFKR
jgi:hypothetical protein